MISNLISLIITKTQVYIKNVQIRMHKNGLFNTYFTKTQQGRTCSYFLNKI